MNALDTESTRLLAQIGQRLRVGVVVEEATLSPVSSTPSYEASK